MNVDTLSIARELRAADLPAEQAEAIAAAIGRAVAESSATKADLDLVRSDLGHDIEQVRADLDRKIEQVRVDLERKIEQLRADLERKIEQVRTEVEKAKNQLILWVITSQVTLAGIIIAVVKL